MLATWSRSYRRNLLEGKVVPVDVLRDDRKRRRSSTEPGRLLVARLAEDASAVMPALGQSRQESTGG
jgi:hypothetical protein